MCPQKDFFVNQRIFEVISTPSELPSTMPWRGDLPSRPKQLKRLHGDISLIGHPLYAASAQKPKNRQFLP
jgi:hypothetical protein